MIPPLHVIIRRLLRLLFGPDDPYLDPFAPWEHQQRALLWGLVGVVLSLLVMIVFQSALRLLRV